MEGSSEAAGTSPDLNLERTIEAGLRAAFRSESDNELGESVLVSIERQGGVLPRVLLRDSRGGTRNVVTPASRKRGDASSTGSRYEIHGEIARGGIGVVLKGRDTDLGREVAIKILRDRHGGKPEMLRRFVEEAQIGGQLQHPGILPVYDLGVRADGKPFFTMKLVQGQTLANLFEAGADSPEERRRCLTILVQVCQTVAYAHACGVVHRDLKPSNIMVGAFGEIQVLDWGLSKVLTRGGVEDDRKAGRASGEPVKVETDRSESEPAWSQAGSVMGTPAYMSPEQAQGEVERLDERSDVFSLGAILCEALTGKPPYVGPTPESIRRLAAQGDLEPALARLEECEADVELVRITKSSLEPQQTARPRDAGVLAKEISTYLASVDERLRQVELSRTAAEARARAEGRARRLTVALAASVLLITLLGGGGYLLREKQKQTRLDNTSRAVKQALGEARLQEGKARAAPDGDLAAWDLAIEAARRASATATAGEADAATHAEVANLLKAFTGAQEEARGKAERLHAERQVLEELRRIPQVAKLSDAYEARVSDTRYAKAFLGYGIDIDGLAAAEAAGAIRNSAIGEELASFLDSWARARRIARNDRSRHWAKLIDIALLADRDEWRTKMREMIRKLDESGLVNLARSAPVQELPAVTLQLVSDALVAIRKHETAVDLLTRSHRRYPNDFRINQALAHSLEQLDPPRWEAAVRFRSAAVAIRPDSVHARIDLSIALRKTGDPDAARAWFESALAIDRTKSCYLALSCKLLVNLDDQDLALEAIEKALEEDPHSADAWYNKGIILFNKGAFEDAARAYQKGIDLEPSAELYNNLGSALSRLDRIEEAKAAYRSGIEKNPHDYLLHCNLGVMHVTEHRDLNVAISELTRSIELNPYFGMSHYQLGLALKRLDRWPEAVVEFGKAIRLGRPHNRGFLADCHNAIGAHNHKKGEFREAEANFRKAIELRKDFAMAHNNLGKALEALGKVQMAHESYRNAYRAALKLEPKNAGLLADLGWDLISQRRHEEAIKLLRRAHSIQPDHILVHSNLGYALQEAGRFKEALETYQEIRKTYPDNHELQGECQEWIKECKRLIELEARLPGILGGEQVPVDVPEIIEFARVAVKKQLWGAAASLWISALASDPGLAADLMSQNIYEVTCSLAMAGCGLGRDSGSFDTKTRAGWRRQALAWLKARLQNWKSLMEAGKKEDLKKVLLELNHWKNDPDLVGLRDGARLEELPEPEQMACRAFWKAVNALLERAGQ